MENSSHYRVFTRQSLVWVILFILGVYSPLYGQSWKASGSDQYPKLETFVSALSATDRGIVGDGVTDNTAAIQTALNDIATWGGGALYLSDGKYVINGGLIIPKGVILRGDWKKPVKGEPIGGTILMGFAGRGDVNSSPLLTLESASAVMDIAIWYPEQNPDNIVAYPPSILFGKPGYWGNDFANAKNVTFVNSYIGLMYSRTNTGGCPIVNGMYGTPLSVGVEIDNIGDVGRIENIDFSPSYWASSGLTGSPAAGSAFANWIYEHGTGIVMRRNDWSYTTYVHVEKYNKGILLGYSMSAGSEGFTPNGHYYDLTFKDCKTAVYAEAVNDVGLLCSNLKIQNCETGFSFRPNTGGVFQIQASQIEATSEAISVDKSSGTKILLNQSLVSKGAINIGGGSLVANNNDFNNDKPQITIGIAARSILNGNRFSKEVDIKNKSILENVIDHTPVSMAQVPSFEKIQDQSRKPSREVLYNAAAAPYNAIGNGTTDNTNAIQTALNQAGTDGGGIVFLPPGKYKVLGHLTIPSGVELRGASDIPSSPLGKGSIIEVYADKGNPNGTPFIKLSSNSGIRALAFNYPEQDARLLPNMSSYPYCIQATGANTYVINIGVRATDKFLDLFTYKCDNHFVDYVMGHVFTSGVKIGGNSKDGIVQNVHVNVNAYAYGGESKWGSWPNSPNPSSEGNLIDASYVHGTNHLQFLEVGSCENLRLYNDFIFGGHNGFILNDNAKGSSLGLGIDGSISAFKVVGSGIESFDLINTQIVAFGSDSRYIETSPNFTGKVTFFNSDYWGNPTKGLALSGGKVEMQTAHFHHPGQTGLASLASGSELSLQASSVMPVNNLLIGGGEAGLSVVSSITNSSGINTANVKLWKNNLAHSPKLSGENVYDRTGWSASASNNTNGARNALDGNPATRWDTEAVQAPGQWFLVDMNEEKDIDAIILDYSASSGDYPVGYEILVSSDGASWNSVATGKGNSNMLFVILDQTVKGRYIKINQTGSKDLYWSIHEFYVYKSEEVAEEVPLDMTGWIASASNNTNAAQNAIDYDDETRWDTEALQAPGQWFMVDMRKEQEFDKLVLDCTKSPNDFPVSYEVYVSNDGTTWGSPIHTGNGSPNSFIIKFESQKYRYIRIVQTGTNPGGYWSIHEFRVYNTNATTPISNSHNYEHYIMYGQSLSTGHESDKLSTDNLDGNYMIGSQVWINYGNQALNTLSPLVATEYGTALGESPLHGAVNHLRKQVPLIHDATGKENRILATSSGTSGKNIEELSKEYQGSEVLYNNYITALEKAKTIIDRTNSTISCPAIIFMQGEFNYYNEYGTGLDGHEGTASGDKATYKNLLMTLKNNMQADAKAQYQQADNPVFYTYQAGAQYTKGRSLEIGMAQLEAANANSDIICVGPIYPMTDVGGHLDANGYRWYGEMIGKVIYKTKVLGETFTPLQPIEISRVEGNKKQVRIKYIAPKLPLVLDTKTLLEMPNYGFNVYLNDVEQSIQNVVIDGSEQDCVLITCANNLDGAIEVTYAGVDATLSGRNLRGHGNLRDSDDYQAFFNYEHKTWNNSPTTSGEPMDASGNVIDGKHYPLYNFSVAFYYKLDADKDKYIVPNLSDMYSDTDISSLKVNGDDWNIENTYVLDCGSSADKIDVAVIPAIGATVSGGKSFSMDVKKPGLYEKVITVTAADGIASKSYTLKVEVPIPFNSIVVQKWNNILAVNNNAATNGGYVFKDYQWFRNGEKIGTNKQYYSAGGKETDILDKAALYSVRMTTADGKSFSTCQGSALLKSSSTKVYPNPVNALEVISLETDMDEDMLKGAKLQVYTIAGSLEKSIPVVGKITPFTLSKAGTFIVKLRTKSGFEEEFKIIAK